MGEVADLITDGVLCFVCNGPVEDSPGFLTMCKACRKREYDRTTGRVATCVANFREASILAAQHGMRLLKHSDEHYQLKRSKPKAIWNLYPRSAKYAPRIYTDKRFRDRTRLNLAGVNWTLLDVVKEAIRVTELEAVK